MSIRILRSASFSLFLSIFFSPSIPVQAQLNIIDPWADAIVDYQAGENARGIPENILGKPGGGDPGVNGEFAPNGGFVIVDMGFGEEIENGPWDDFTIIEGGDNEDYQVWVSNQSDGEWIDLGMVNGNHSFDIEGINLEKVRYVKIEDRGYTSDGADIESIEAIYYPNDPWADEVVSLDIHPDWVGKNEPEQSDPSAAIGPIDDREISLPFSTIVVRFTDNTVIDADGDDLFIAESGEGGESARISISDDGRNWVELGIADNSTTTAFDLASVGYSKPVVYVRIEGLNAGGSAPGFDLDAVFALPNSIGAPPPPSDNLIEIFEPGFEIADSFELTGLRPLYPAGFQPLFSENRDLFLVAADTMPISSPYAMVMKQREGEIATTLIRVVDPSPGKQILGLWGGGSDQMVLLIGPGKQEEENNPRYFIVRVNGPFGLTSVSHFGLY